MEKFLNILVLEDQVADAELLIHQVERAGYKFQWRRVETEADFLAELTKVPDLILSDYSLPNFNGLRALTLLRERGWDTPFILVSGTLGEESAVEAMKLGADDYLLKDRIMRIGSAIARVLELKQSRDERKRAQAALNLFRVLVDRSNDGIEVVDPDTGRFLDVNQRTCDRLGYSHEEMLGMTVPDIDPVAVTPQTWAKHLDEIRQAGFKVIRGEHRRKDGSTFPIEAHVQYVKLERDYLIAGVRDISDRVQAEAALRESQALYHSLVEQMPAGIFRKNLQGRYEFANDYFCRLKGIKLATILGKTPTEFTSNELLNRAPDGPGCEMETKMAIQGEEHHQIILRTGETITVEEEYLRDGVEKMFFQALKCPVFGQDGKITGSQGILIDVTERKGAEEKINKQLEELQRWHEAMLGREERVLELKNEVNELAAQLKLPPRYSILNPAP